MLIKSSKFLIFAKSFLLILILFLFMGLFFRNQMPIQDVLITTSGISIIPLILYWIMLFPDVEVDDDQSKMGGMPYLRFSPDTLRDVFRTRQFVTRDSVNSRLTNKRTTMQKFFGMYVIYDQNKRAFIVYKHFFWKKDFRLIQNKLDEILGLKI